MSYTRIWIHAVFSTINRIPILHKEGRYKLFFHIKSNCITKNIYLDQIGGFDDHIHLLLSLGKKQNIADVMQQIKGESSFWANQQMLFKQKLIWQDDYFAVSVSESQIEHVRKYIINQENHHRKKSFQGEAEEFMIKFHWEQTGNKQ